MPNQHRLPLGPSEACVLPQRTDTRNPQQCSGSCTLNLRPMGFTSHRISVCSLSNRACVPHEWVSPNLWQLPRYPVIVAWEFHCGNPLCPTTTVASPWGRTGPRIRKLNCGSLQTDRGREGWKVAAGCFTPCFSVCHEVVPDLLKVGLPW